MSSSSFTSCYRLLSYTKLISTHISHSRHHEALAVFHHIHSTLALPLDPHVFSLILKSCTSLHRIQLATSLHAHLTKSSFLSNPFVSSSLLHLYGTCISLSQALQLFHQTTPRNVVVWNTIISLYAHHLPTALQLFHSMDIPPNESTFNPIIAALAASNDGSFNAISFYRKMITLNLKPRLITLLALLPAAVGVAALNLVKEIHGYAVRNWIDPHHQLSSGLVEAYGRCGSIVYADSVFWRMRDKDVVAWSSVISAYALHGEANTALGIFRQMEVAGVKPDGITFLAVLKACSHAGLADEALWYFRRMREDYGVEPSSDHYSCLVDVLSRAGRLQEAYEVIKGMPVKVTAKAWGALLGACRNFGELRLGEIAGRALAEVEPGNAANYVLLAKMYASVGRMEEAQKVMREMKERGVKATAGSSWVVYSES
ncbi:putative pentatricopeptide repeat-containing protein At1g03510 [Abrus precatorius]|uniref:Pentatricopeptide repeat-containing protein At1g03510 n=1 Tax=Abrus precatorius TaxID=3816 RepID=A0A8B8KDQ1_ABRPR|nr:putative pentatricopeptide repeat-containing protein At1g03510 [Abrus precatorius]